jgi:hypothetical protein
MSAKLSNTAPSHLRQFYAFSDLARSDASCFTICHPHVINDLVLQHPFALFIWTITKCGSCDNQPLSAVPHNSLQSQPPNSAPGHGANPYCGHNIVGKRGRDPGGGRRGKEGSYEKEGIGKTAVR